MLFFLSSRRRHTRSLCDWSSDVCSSDLLLEARDVGPVLAQSIRQFFAEPHNLEVVAQLRAAGVHWPESAPKKIAAGKLARSEERRVGKGGILWVVRIRTVVRHVCMRSLL